MIFLSKKSSGGGVYSPSIVDTQGSAYLKKTGSLASDSTILWGSFIVEWNTVSGTQNFYDMDGRTLIRRIGSNLDFDIDNTGATPIFEGSLAVSTGSQDHYYFEFDGGGSPSFTLYKNGTDVTGSMSITTAATSGTVDHTRTDFEFFGSSLDANVGDLLWGTSSPPGISAVYDGGFKDVSAVSADVKVIGDATVWNANPSGMTTNNTFIDA